MTAMNEPNYILEANLLVALEVAVLALKEKEAGYGPDFCSSFRAGLQDALAAHDKGNPIVIKRE